MLPPTETPLLMIDHCAVEHGKTLEAITYESTVTWGGQPVTHSVSAFRRRVIEAKASWLRVELEAMNAIAKAARMQTVRLCSSPELFSERMLSCHGTAGLIGDVWIGVNFCQVDSPVDRSGFGGLSTDQFCSRDHQERFYRNLISLIDKPNLRQKVREFLYNDAQRESLDHLEEFASITLAAGESRICDAFHLWSAIRSGCKHFVTTDFKFQKALHERHDDSMICSIVVKPTQACEALGLTPIPLPLAEGEVVSFAAAVSYFSTLREKEDRGVLP